MPKLLNLISLRHIIKGGSSKPVSIQAEDENGKVSSYVLKLFKKKHVDQNYSSAKEILGVELAKDFDLPVSDYGIINFDHKYLKSFFDDKYISELDIGYKFCSELKEGMVIYDSSGTNRFLKNYDLENVFGFDNIILNTDRGGYRYKPNLLVGDDDFLLIDHETILPHYTSGSIEEQINYKNKFNSYIYTNHIFYNDLKKKRKKGIMFDETIMHLSNFDLKKIDNIFADFDKFNITCGNKNKCYSYFKWLKDNINDVYNTLNNRLFNG
ncbi:HipA family kinase [Abyssalbus ytuae]|uniref:HipA-like kinase domain-containing protein n=1 Tax=Abyssalbus ytuae TaxID=2926907 RepID=A0A9E6ZQV3_9FLAO|nr:HipA family kinase [Abyssalbus ytuae]UOB17118.1 hypothetical protein MQE35_15425 [Abyssalbus ytuae]